jgi:hypothetical protein
MDTGSALYVLKWSVVCIDWSKQNSSTINHSWATTPYCNITLTKAYEKMRSTVGCFFKITILPLSWDLRLKLHRASVVVRKKEFSRLQLAKPPAKFYLERHPVPLPASCVFTQYTKPPYWSGELFSMVNKYSGKVICSAYNLGDPLASSALSRQRMQWITQPYPLSLLPLLLPPPHDPSTPLNVGSGKRNL